MAGIRSRRRWKIRAPHPPPAGDRKRRAPTGRGRHRPARAPRSCGPTRCAPARPRRRAQGLLAEADPLPSPDDRGASSQRHRAGARPDHRSAQCRRHPAHPPPPSRAPPSSRPRATARKQPACWRNPPPARSNIVPIVTVQNLARGLAALKERGFLLVGLDSDGESDLGGCRAARAARARARRRRQGLAAIDARDLRHGRAGSICPARSRASTCRMPPRLRSMSRRRGSERKAEKRSGGPKPAARWRTATWGKRVWVGIPLQAIRRILSAIAIDIDDAAERAGRHSRQWRTGGLYENG